MTDINLEGAEIIIVGGSSGMMPAKYPVQQDLAIAMPTRDQICIFRVVPKVISVLDYSKGFGHADLVTL